MTPELWVSLAIMIAVVVVLAIAWSIPLGRLLLDGPGRIAAALLLAIATFLLPYLALRLAGGVSVVRDDGYSLVVTAPPAAAWTWVYRWVIATDRAISHAVAEPAPSR